MAFHTDIHKRIYRFQKTTVKPKIGSNMDSLFREDQKNTTIL